MILLSAMFAVSCGANLEDNGVVSWEEQLKIAQSKVDSDAVLYDVTATLLEPGNVNVRESNLATYFTFVRPTGETQRVYFLGGGNGPGIWGRHQDQKLNSVPTQEELNDLRVRKEMIHIGPREVLERTLAEGQSFASKYHRVNDLSVILFLDMERDEYTVSSGKTIWRVLFNILLGNDVHQLVVDVDVESGDIVNRRMDDLK